MCSPKADNGVKMSYLKSLIFVSVLLSQVALAQKVDDNDPMGVIVPEGSYMFSFCLEKTSICGVKKPKKEVYSGMKGKLTSLSPVKVEYGRNNIFEIKMENGDFLYFHTEDESPFKQDALIRLSKHIKILDSAGKSIIPGGSVKVERVFYDNGIGYKYVLSTGQEIWGDKFSSLKAFLPNIPKEREVEFVKMIDDLEIKHDDVEDRFFISIYTGLITDDRKEPPLRPYVGFKSGNAWMRFKLYYEADDWLFVNKVLIKADDYKQEFTGLTFERDHTGGTIWEWYDRNITDNDIKLIQRVIASDEAVVRFYGRQYYNDRTVSFKQRQQLSNMLSIYEMLK